MQITNEFIEQLNSVIAMAIEHGGDAGGAYFCYPDELFEELQNLVSLMDKDLKVVWKETEYSNSENMYPIIVNNRKEQQCKEKHIH